MQYERVEGLEFVVGLGIGMGMSSAGGMIWDRAVFGCCSVMVIDLNVQLSRLWSLFAD
jgi:hypothetical protein